MTAPSSPRKYPVRETIGHLKAAALRTKGLRWCPKCKRALQFAEFNKTAANFGGLSSYCKLCCAARAAVMRKRARERPDATAMARFLAKRTVIRTGCWFWRGAINPVTGHGCFAYRGQGIAAHVAACYLFDKEVPAGKIARLTCGVPCCCNPGHVAFCTRQEMSLIFAKDNPFRRNAQKSRCLRGHEFSKDNTWHIRVGQSPPSRVCLMTEAN